MLLAQGREGHSACKYSVPANLKCQENPEGPTYIDSVCLHKHDNKYVLYI